MKAIYRRTLGVNRTLSMEIAAFKKLDEDPVSLYDAWKEHTLDIMHGKAGNIGAYKGYPVPAAMRDRGFIHTVNSRAGLTASRTREGDLICILGNGIVPYVLRWSNRAGAAISIGEAYVDGPMYGEVSNLQSRELVDPSGYVHCVKPHVTLIRECYAISGGAIEAIV